MGLYDATKAGILAMTRTLACEESAHGVRVNAVCPGSTLTDFHVSKAKAAGKSVEMLKTERQTTSLLARWAIAAGDCLANSVAGKRRGLLHDRRNADGRRRSFHHVTERSGTC